MFSRQKGQGVSLINTPSFLLNNLTSDENGYQAFVSNDTVEIISPANKFTSVNFDGAATYIKYISIENCSFLALTTNLGVQIWSNSGDKLLFSYQINKIYSGEEYNENISMSGITYSNGNLYIGLSTGDVAVFENPDRSNVDKNNLTLIYSHLLTTFDLNLKFSILLLASTNKYLVLGNEIGTIFVYDLLNGCSLTHKFQGNKSMITSLEMSDLNNSITQTSTGSLSLIFASFSTGHIRIYNAEINEILIEILAHSRIITGLDFRQFYSSNYEDSEKINLLASVSTDNYLTVWSIPSFNNNNHTVNLLTQKQVENEYLTGVTFVDPSTITVASYEKKNLIVFKK